MDPAHARSSESVHDNGRADPTGRDDVVVFTGRNFHGKGGCIRLGQRGDLGGGFVNNIQSYRWVRPAICNRYPTALDLRPRR